MLLHLSLAASLGAWHWWNNRAVERFGEANSLGASAGVSAVAQIPIMRRQGRLNPVANDTESQLQTPELKKAQPKPRPEPEDPNAIPLNRRQKKTEREIVATNQRYRPDPILPNQVTSTSGRALVNPMMGVTGSGGVGTSDSSPFGARFGWYEKLLRERVGQKWRTDDVDSRLRSAPPAIVTFTIARDGNVSGVRIFQSSGNYALDNSALRAIHEASPMPPLPGGFEKPSAQIEFQFELKR